MVVVLTFFGVALFSIPAWAGEYRVVKAIEIAEVINNNGPLAVQAILKTTRETEGMHENEAFKPDTANGIPVFLSEDAKEGPRALAEKRRPVWTGR